MSDAAILAHPWYGPLLGYLQRLSADAAPNAAIGMLFQGGTPVQLRQIGRVRITDPALLRIPLRPHALTAAHRAVVAEAGPLLATIQAAGLTGYLIWTVRTGVIDPVPEWEPGVLTLARDRER